MIIKLELIILPSFFFHKFNNIFISIKKILFSLLHSPSCSVKAKWDLWCLHNNRINIFSFINPPYYNINFFHILIPACFSISFNVLI